MNIVLVVWDATRAQNLSCYGYHRPTTPVLDRLLQDDDHAVLYSNAYSASVWTLSAMASIFTGTYVSRHNTHWGNISLNPSLPTLATLLSQRGYETIGLSANRAWASWHSGLDRGFQQFYETRGGILQQRQSSRAIHTLNRVLPKICHEFRLPEIASWYTTRTACKAVERYAGATKPFFLYAHYVEAHLKYAPPFHHRPFFRWGKDVFKQFSVNMNAVAYLAGAVDMAADDFRLLVDLYDNTIHYQDYCLGKLFDRLKRQGIWDDTMIIVTADHGENLGEHGLMEHRYCLYDTLLHVPLVIKYPRSVLPPQKTATVLAQPHDIVPTALELVGQDGQGDARRFPDAASLISGDGGRTYAVSEYVHPQITQGIPQQFDLSRYNRALRSLRTSNHKYIWSGDGNDEFYDLAVDSEEMNNVICDPSYASDVEVLRKQYREWSSQFERSGEEVSGMDRRITEDQDVQERLRSLGYLD